MMNKQNKKMGTWARFLIVMITLSLVACGSDVEVTTTLNNTRDVKEGADVFLDQQIVGQVKDVSHSDGKTRLTIELDEAFAGNVKQNAAVVVNRLKPDSPIEIYNQKASAEVVQNGAELQGLNSMFQLGAWMVGDSLDMGADSLSSYVDAFQKYLKGDGWKQDKKVLEEQAQQVATVAEEAVKQAATEMEKMQQEFSKVEEGAAAVVEKMGEELAPVFGELAKSGQSIVQELEKFATNLEQRGDNEKAVGADFMESLERALETLNQSIEQSLETPPAIMPVPEQQLEDGNTTTLEREPETAGGQQDATLRDRIEASEKIAEGVIQETHEKKEAAKEPFQ